MRIAVTVERWPIRDGFRIARGRKTEAEVVVAELSDDTHVGRGECVPYPRYGETVEAVVSELEALGAELAQGMTREELQRSCRPGSARNALDCALWDLEAKREGAPVWKLAGLEPPRPVQTAFTIDLSSPEEVERRIKTAPRHGWLKLKLDDTHVLERLQAAREAAPQSRLIADANESWSVEQLEQWLPSLGTLGVELLEQPLPAGADQALADIEHAVPICADESFHDRGSFDDIQSLYDAVNLKLDKCGGLTEAIAAMAEARSRGMRTMVGCMVCTSLSIAPAFLLAGHADYVDLDGPMLLEADRSDGLLQGSDGRIRVTESLWGGP